MLTAAIYLLLINYIIHSIDITYYLLYDIEFQIVLNIDKFYFIFKDVLGILSGIIIFYYGIYLINTKLEKSYNEFIKRHNNLMPTKTNYFLHIQLLKTAYKIHDFSMAILMFIALVQYTILDKKVNFINYILLNAFAQVQSLYAWYQDLQIHKQNKRKVRIIRGEERLTVSNSEVCVGDILCMKRDDTVRVKEAIVDQRLVAFSLGQTGEETNEEYKANSVIPEGLILVNDEEVQMKVIKTFSDSELVEDDVNTVKEISEKSTKMALFSIISFAMFIYYSKMDKVFDIVDFLLDMIGCFIGLNYLIPSFKIQQSMNLFDSVCRYICQTQHQFKICNHGNIDVTFSPDDTELVFDKTGTLTDNKLTIEQFYINTEDQKRNVCLIAAHINSIYRRNKHTSHSPETNVISDFLLSNYGVKPGENHHWTDMAQQLDIKYTSGRNLQKSLEKTYNDEKVEITRHKKYIYSAKNLGSHSLVEYENQNYSKGHSHPSGMSDKHTGVQARFGEPSIYHIFMGQKSLLYERLNHKKEEVSSKKRGMIIGYIKLQSIEEFEGSLTRFRNKEAVIEDYTIIGEFHFNNYYRCQNQENGNSNKSTQSGIDGLKKLGYRVNMITGDALVTAEDIGRELGIVDEKTEIMNGEEFVNRTIEEQDEMLNKVFSRKGNVIFGRTKAEFKGHIVERFQKCGKKVIYGGDQENDYHAILKANIGIAQEGGNKKCKNIANLEGDIPTETAFRYLTKYRALGIEGKAWFYKELTRFNYTTAGIWLVGISILGFEKVNLLFIDPWSALMSLLMSISVTVMFIYRAIKRDNKKISIEEVVYYIPIKSLFRGLVAGYVLYLSGLSYITYSIPLITGMMIFLT